jgi:hypothetical protein
MQTKRQWAVVARSSVLCALLCASAARADDPTSSPGVWQKHQYSFDYFGFTSTYSCDGLADKLKRLLIAAGARKDVKAVSGPCAAPFGRPDKLARADLTFYSLAPDPAGTAKAGEAANGVWHAIELAPNTPRELELGDCELVDGFVSKVLPLLAVRNLENHTTCVPHQVAGSSFDVRFESFEIPPPPPHSH